MDKYKNTYSLLSQILDVLTNKITYSTTVDALCNEIQDSVPEGSIKGFDSVKSAVQFALNVGVELGIIALEDSPCIKHPKKKPIMEKDDKDKGRAATEARLVYGAVARKKPIPTKKPVPANGPKLSVKLARQSQKRAASRVSSDCANCLKRHRRLPRK